MLTRYTILNPDGTSQDGSIDWPERPHFLTVEKFVSPFITGPMEHVTVNYHGQRADMFVDELGHNQARDGKPRNDAATAMYRTQVLLHRPEMDPNALPWIAGVAVLFHRLVWF